MSIEPPPVVNPVGGNAPPRSQGRRVIVVRGPAGRALLAFMRGWKRLSRIKGANFALTGISMLISLWFYSARFGLEFSVLFVVALLVHEMGHIAVTAYLKVPATAPIFIPWVGAIIFQKKCAPSAWGEAIIGIGGPIGGATAGLILWAVAMSSGSHVFFSAACFTFALNLFNMIPMFPLDGGRIVGAVSPYLWLVGLVALGGLALAGFLSIAVLLIVGLSMPQVINGIRRGTADPSGGEVTSKRQRIVMGLCYVLLSGMLLCSTAATWSHLELPRQAV